MSLLTFVSTDGRRIHGSAAASQHVQLNWKEVIVEFYVFLAKAMAYLTHRYGRTLEI